MFRYRCPVKSGNERDPCPMLPRFPLDGLTFLGKVFLEEGSSTHRRPLLIKQRKEWSTAGQYGLNPLGNTRPTMAGIMGCHPVRGS